MEFFEKISADKAKLLSPTVLAFVGDAVMTLYVREHLAKSSDAKAGRLHVLTAKTVCSKAQAELLDGIFGVLSEEEKEIFRRSRNTKTHSVSKNGTLADYKKASGLEAVLGYHYLTGNFARCKEILDFTLKKEISEN